MGCDINVDGDSEDLRQENHREMGLNYLQDNEQARIPAAHRVGSAFSQRYRKDSGDGQEVEWPR